MLYSRIIQIRKHFASSLVLLQFNVEVCIDKHEYELPGLKYWAWQECLHLQLAARRLAKVLPSKR